MSRNLSQADEQQLMDGVKLAVSFVDNDGMTPNEALKKVAEDLGYTPGFLKAACHAFNTGRQLNQWNENDSILDKLASFPLANYDKIHQQIWGQEKEKQASVSLGNPILPGYDDIYRDTLKNFSLTPLMKQAADEKPTNPVVVAELNDMRMKKAFAQVDQAERMAEHYRHLKGAAYLELETRLNRLEDYFKKSAYDRLHFAQVDQAASLYYGNQGKTLMNYLAERLPHEKRASEFRASWDGFAEPVDRTKEPYTLIANVIDQVREYAKAEKAAAAANEKLASAKDGAAPFIQGATPQTTTPSTFSLIDEKQAGIGTALAGGAGFGVAKSLADSVGTDSDKKINSQMMSLDSPGHIDELRRIRAQTALTQAMSDPEDPLSQFDPEDVLSSYNELVQLSPRLADQPAAIGPLLRKRLLGNVEPFELGETLKLEKGLKDTQAPPSMDLMRNANSIIG